MIQENSNKTNQEKFKIYKPKIDIECGANTKFKLEEISEDDYFKLSEESSSDEDFWKYNINFDNPKEDAYEPYTAQVKLLLHKDLFAELESLKKIIQMNMIKNHILLVLLLLQIQLLLMSLKNLIIRVASIIINH